MIRVKMLNRFASEIVREMKISANRKKKYLTGMKEINRINEKAKNVSRFSKKLFGNSKKKT